MLDLNSNVIYAGKIISKHRISKPHQRQKIMREVELQRPLKHRNVVEFHSFFEDEENVYIVLENCNRKSLVYMLKHRKTLTEPEVRYYMGQLVDGVKYIQEHDIIHRDLKLGNMLLNDDMDVKIADFGLATRVEYDGEKKMTVCGTPNYIAPEVLQKRGHSYEADTWALGCVMYALLVGHPPFETATLKETYIRITENRYSIPDWISPQARHLITKCLTNEPELRPSLDSILMDDFFKCGHYPNRLPPSCCTSPPRFQATSAGSFVRVSRPKSYAVPETRPESGVDRITSPIRELEITNRHERQHSKGRHTPDFSIPMSRISGRTSGSEMTRSDRSDSPALRESSPKPRSAANLLDVLTTCLEHMPKDVIKNPEPMSDMTILWVSKWVDYSNKYGFGFQLSNDSIGVLFNDTSKIILSPDGRSVQYYDMTGHLMAFSVDQPPDDLDKKTTLLMYFAKYMDEHLIQGGNIECSKDSDDISVGSLCLKKWFRTAKAIVLYLNDGTLQVNFFDDHTKIILSYMRNDYFVTYIDEERCATTYSMVHLIQDGCRRDIMDRMTFSRSMLKNLVDIEGVDI
ncbi:serine/threonine-protein kinase PLK1-like isoform X2 [Ruditapes philippinarum]|nr:serine/threonine-protein kinase PLK1-like isoform X2 [Ruditapes philippinarum]